MNEWHPYSEENPTRTGQYLVTLDFEDIEAVLGIDGYDADADEWYDEYGSREYCVVAWMPLPKPYDGTRKECLDDGK